MVAFKKKVWISACCLGMVLAIGGCGSSNDPPERTEQQKKEMIKQDVDQILKERKKK